MKARWQTLRMDERRIAQILVLEMLFELDQSKRTHEVIARSKDFLDDVAAIIHEFSTSEDPYFRKLFIGTTSPP